MLGIWALMASLGKSDGARAGVWSAVIPSGPAPRGLGSLYIWGHPQLWEDTPGHILPCHSHCVTQGMQSFWHGLFLGKGFEHSRNLTQFCVGIVVVE